MLLEERQLLERSPLKISWSELPCLVFKGSLKSAPVVLHRLWSEGHRHKAVGVAGHAHPNRIHRKDVTDAGVSLGGAHRAVLGEDIIQHDALNHTCMMGNSPT